MHIFYQPEITPENLSLNEEESGHAIRVLRLIKGDAVQLVDGKGGFYKAEITEANSKQCRLLLLDSQKEYGKRPYHLHIAMAPTKSSDRTEWFLEKATEIGIEEITPLYCKHSERTTVKPDRLNKVLVAAMKQSLKSYLPSLQPQEDFKNFIRKSFEGQKFIAHCRPSSSKIPLKKCYEKNHNVLILIGPEGDFTQEEIDLAKLNGFIETSLSDSRLRTETAALMACAAISILND